MSGAVAGMLLSLNFTLMPPFANTQLAPIALSLFAMTMWGFSDFLGGFASRRTNAFLVTTIAHFSGTIFMITLALAWHAPLPTRSQILWSMAAGFFGGSALAIFYRALAMGQMGLTAPVSALLGAAIPTVAGFFSEGLPNFITIIGFGLAAIGIWLISRSEDGAGRPAGLGLALLSGIGFAGFFLCVKQAGNASPIWIAGFARVASFVTTSAIVLGARQWQPFARAGLAFGLLAGMLDSSGSALFAKASQTGRLDTAVVLSSLYPAITVLLARLILREHFSRWKVVGLAAALLAVPMIAM
jgi:drug/metabolite transporter (DMT)-like permease